MSFTLYYLYLATLSLCTWHQTLGAYRHCGSTDPVVDMCTNSNAILTPNVFIETVTVPTQQHSRCSCTITPSTPFTIFLLTYRKLPSSWDKFYMQFRLNDVTLNKTIFRDKTTLKRESKLVLTTEKPHVRSYGVCLLVDTADTSRFNITCEEIAKTTAYITRSTLTTGVAFEAKALDTDNEKEVSHIGPIVGGAVGGLVCLILVTMIIVLCRRKVVSKKHESSAVATANSDNTQDTWISGNECHLINPDDDSVRPASDRYEF